MKKEIPWGGNGSVGLALDGGKGVELRWLGEFGELGPDGPSDANSAGEMGIKIAEGDVFNETADIGKR